MKDCGVSVMYGSMHNPWPQGQDLLQQRGEKHREFFDLQSQPEKPRQIDVSLLIDGRDRDLSFDAQRGQSAPYNFVSRFETIYNVVSAQLKILACPKPSTETYAVIDIPQFSASLNSTDSSSHQKFAAVFFEPSVGVKPCKPDMITNPTVTFNPPVNLNRLDICLRTWGGDVLQAPSGNVSMVFNLTCNEASKLN